MSQSAITILAPLPFELVYDDGEPFAADWHSHQLPLLAHLLRQTMLEHGRTDFWVAAHVFLYYSVEQAREVAEEEEKGLPRRAYRGPDVFWVAGVDPKRNRMCWIAWEEDGRLPNVVFEMFSTYFPTKSLAEKQDLHASVLRTPEYFVYEPDTRILEGLRLTGQLYEPIQPDEHGRLWSEELGVSVGLWHGVVEGRRRDWVRLFRPDGTLVPTQFEAARLRAEAARQRADEAKAELARLRALLAERDRS
jgi:Uma2 family endonuclease